MLRVHQRPEKHVRRLWRLGAARASAKGFGRVYFVLVLFALCEERHQHGQCHARQPVCRLPLLPVRCPRPCLSTGRRCVVSHTAMHRKLYKSNVAAFNEAFFNAQQNTYDTVPLQTTYVMPLWLDLVPASNLRAVFNNLLNDIVVTHTTHLSTGILGAHPLQR